MSKLRDWLIHLLGGYTRKECFEIKDDLDRANDVNKKLDAMVDELLTKIGVLQEYADGNTCIHVEVNHAVPYRVQTELGEFFFGANAVDAAKRRCRAKLAHDIAEMKEVEVYRDVFSGRVKCAAEAWLLNKEVKDAEAIFTGFI
jgi:hypothetical protein